LPIIVVKSEAVIDIVAVIDIGVVIVAYYASARILPIVVVVEFEAVIVIVAVIDIGVVIVAYYASARILPIIVVKSEAVIVIVACYASARILLIVGVEFSAIVVIIAAKSMSVALGLRRQIAGIERGVRILSAKVTLRGFRDRISEIGAANSARPSIIQCTANRINGHEPPLNGTVARVYKLT
jgi:hypothetical protein